MANKIIIPFVHSFALEWASVHVVCAPVKKAMLGPSVTFALTQRYMCNEYMREVGEMREPL